MVVAVSPTTQKPKHDLTLTWPASDGTVLGFVFSDSSGLPNPQAVSESPLQTTALQVSQGNSKYSGREFPFMDLVQDDWSAGRGLRNWEDNTSRYFDSYRVQTDRVNRVILGGLETYTTGHKVFYQNMPGSLSWVQCIDTNKYQATRFTIGAAGFTADYLELWIRKTGTPTGNLVAAIYSDTGGTEPNAALVTKTLSVASVTDVVSQLYKFDFTGTQALTAATNYWVVIYSAGATDSSTNCWEVGNDGISTLTGSTSSDGATWYPKPTGLFYRVMPVTATLKGKYFEYKRALYFLSQPDAGGNSSVYMNGYRGAADSNSGTLTKLIDGTASFGTDVVGGIVIITGGPGSGENQPWREVTARDSATQLTVSPAWNITHTTSTEYVIVGTNVWSEVIAAGTLAAFCTDVEVAGEFVYFARGSSNNIMRYQEYNAAGTWTKRTPTADLAPAIDLLYVRHPTQGDLMFGSHDANAAYGSAVWKATVPAFWGSLYRDIGEITPTNTPWDGNGGVSNVTLTTDGAASKITLAAGFTTGNAGSIDMTAAPVDLTEGLYLGFKIYSDVACSAGDLQLILDDTVATPNTVTLNIPALTANTWTWATIAIAPYKDTTVFNWREVEEIELNVAYNNGAQNIWFFDGIHLLGDEPEYIDLPNDVKVTNLTAYAGNATDPQLNPWIHTENRIYEIQLQNSDAVIELPIGELKELRSERSGLASAVNDVYLYFSLGQEKLERYFNRSLDDIGPDLDEGLPSNRTGTVSAILSYPGRIYIAIDGESSNYSSILEYKSNGWHEVYRAPRTGESIRTLFHQVIPGSKTGRLWFTQGSDLMHVLISLNPLQDSDFLFTHEGYIISSWIYGGMVDLLKSWRSIKLFCEDVGLAYPIEVDYQTNNTTSWTNIGEIYSKPSQELDFSSATPPELTSRRLRYRLRFYNSGYLNTPELNAVRIDAYGIAPPKYRLEWTVRLEDGTNNIDLQEDQEQVLGTYANVESAITKLKAAVAAGTSLTLNSRYSVYDNRTVILASIADRPYRINSEGQIESFLVNLVTHER